MSPVSPHQTAGSTLGLSASSQWRKTILRIGILAVAIAATLVGGKGPVAATAEDAGATFSSMDESAYVDAINAVRVEHGLTPLTVDPNMTQAAREWTSWMVTNSTLQHADDIVTGAPANWLRAGENVGRGPTVPRVWRAFLDSPGHRANVLDPSYTSVGVGVMWHEDGRHYTTHRFASTLDSLEDLTVPGPDAQAPTQPEDLSFAYASPDRLVETLELLVEAGR